MTCCADVIFDVIGSIFDVIGAHKIEEKRGKMEGYVLYNKLSKKQIPNC